MNRGLLFSCVLLCLLCCEVVKAQSLYYQDDARLWIYFKLNKKLNSKLDFQLNVQNRIDNNMAVYSQFYVYPELTYKVTKVFRLVAGYVLGKKRQLDGYYFTSQQAYAGFILKKNLQKFTFSYRNLLQQQSRNFPLETTNAAPVLFDRNKLTLNYEITKRWEVYAAEEISSRLYPYPQWAFKRSRSFLGTKFNFTKHSYLELYFMTQIKQYDHHLPGRDFIYGITFSQDL